MPKPIQTTSDIQVGDYYEDCAFHPCLCTSTDQDEDELMGISLVDGSHRACSAEHCGVRLLTVEEAILWKFKGPADEILEDRYRWW